MCMSPLKSDSYLVWREVEEELFDLVDVLTLEVVPGPAYTVLQMSGLLVYDCSLQQLKDLHLWLPW